mmetsp:Transcript_19808/g.74891  ORF Transcript_19808/g.74891 Transcript_19808/m.74891 type:complete len:290 (-) Transcript_19808:256-1125(-)|eukprot:scaffold553_cov238-Pinguiococcus_pyrenoidosus.AAC.11
MVMRSLQLCARFAHSFVARELPQRRKLLVCLPLRDFLSLRDVLRVVANAVHWAIVAASRGAVLAPRRPIRADVLQARSGVGTSHQARFEVEIREAFPLDLQALQFAPADVVDAVDRAQRHGGRDRVCGIASLLEHPRPPEVVFHEEGLRRVGSAVGAADASVLVHVHEPGEQRLARHIVRLDQLVRWHLAKQLLPQQVLVAGGLLEGFPSRAQRGQEAVLFLHHAGQLLLLEQRLHRILPQVGLNLDVAETPLLHGVVLLEEALVLGDLLQLLHPRERFGLRAQLLLVP